MIAAGLRDGCTKGLRRPSMEWRSQNFWELDECANILEMGRGSL